MADIRRQLRSGTVVLGGMGLLAAALTACSSDPDKRCVDRDSYTLGRGYKVVANVNCPSANGSWYYGGKTKDGFVNGGSFTRPGKGSGGGSHGVDRGGFGSHGKTGG
ncbi:hypothetical protein [Streptomyces chiangmaiensis]|uniref:Lipoprotein n=1 Tax=Streptomyces chiangmaiensis TaxID=766497 RepID=A0ABU7FDD5_9ACTN|nr:hypothetical protein [Streptomyces chiangmaiensis]MED7822104.1 hypothetical protein [Streptomyces chiangmaiensis]